MRRLSAPTIIAIISVLLLSSCAAAQPTPEEQQRIDQLKEELARAQTQIAAAEQDDQSYSSGLIKTLIALRLEILRTNHALIQQRIHALESGAEIDIVVTGSEPDPELAASLLAEIETQRVKVEEAEQEANKYSGGLVRAMALSTLATARTTLAMLEQRYFSAEYGLTTPVPSSPPTTPSVPATAAGDPANDCLKIEDFDSSVLSRNDVFVELAWRINVANSCAQQFRVSANFSIYDSDDFELDSDDETVLVPANGTAIARGKMLVSPPSKAQRMSKQGASLSMR